MLGHYLRLAIRGFAGEPLHACLSVGVLSLGLACFIGAAVCVLYLGSFDAQFRRSERLHVLYQGVDRPAPGLRTPLGFNSDPLLKDRLELAAPELAAIARFAVFGRSVSIGGGLPQARSVAFADARWAELFDLNSVAGDARTVLEQPRGAIVTEQAAQQLFGSEPALGKTITISDLFGSVEVTIGAVVTPISPPSHLAAGEFSTGLQIVAAWEALYAINARLRPAAWGQYMFTATYAILPPDGSLTLRELNRRLRVLGERWSAERADGTAVSFEARHVSRVIEDRVQTQLQGWQSSTSLQFTTILLAFAGLILGIACLNFVNLATARAASHAREVGVRKALGASARNVILQDLAQTAVAVAAAILFALAIVWLGGRLAAERWQGALALPWPRREFWMLIGALLVAVTLVAGAYPAAVLARTKPMIALRLGALRAGPKLLRGFLVGVQFAAATFLIFAVVVFYLQTERARGAALGRYEDPYVVLGQAFRLQENVAYEMLAAELGRGPGVKGVAGMSSYPWGGALDNRQRISRSAGPEDAGAAETGTAWVTRDYRSLLEIPLLAGRWFSDDRADAFAPGDMPTSPRRVVIDARTARALRFPNPAAAIGEVAYLGDDRAALDIIGVIENAPFSLRSRGGGDGFVYWLNPESATITLVRLAPDRVAEGLAHIENVRKMLVPNAPVGQTQFIDGYFERAYSNFERISRVVIVLAAFAIAIAGIGLLGMARFVAVRRTREIGLRKTQGATTLDILRLLLTDFSRPVLIANLAIWPLAYVAARAYVNLFIDRMTLTPLPFLLTLVATVLVAWLVIGVRVVRVARVSPTVALRQE